MAKASTKVKQNPQLRERPISGGRIALYLEYYLGRKSAPKLDENGNRMYYQTGDMAGKPMYVVHHERKKEELKLYLVAKPRTPEERERNRETVALAEKIRQEKEQQRLRGEMGYSIDSKRVDNVFDFFDAYVKDYAKKDIRNITLSLNRFKAFVREKYPMCVTRKPQAEIERIEKEWEDKYKRGFHPLNENSRWTFHLKPNRLDKEMVKAFVDWLGEHGEGGGPMTAWKRFRKVIKAAVEQGVLKTNPCEGIRVVYDENILSKEVLSAEEVKQLLATEVKGQNMEVRRAFTTSLFTGIRWCDIVDLRFSDVDYTNRLLTFNQAKTKHSSSKSFVTIPLTDFLLEVIGTPEEHGRGKTDRIFDLPSPTMANKSLGHWVKRAGIDKHITWHCGRHTFATLVLEGGASVPVVASLLGHSSISMTQKYTRARDAAKKAAMESLPKIG